VRSYLFNSQLIATPAGTVLVAPAQAAAGRAAACLRRLVEQGLVARVVHVDLGESMANGGGPACLRLRVPLTDAEISALSGHVVVDETLDDALAAWVDRHYRDRLSPQDLGDPLLAREGMTALDELTKLLGIGAVYDFQRTA
jgi:succinylarginine dihydrolase